MFVLPLGVEKQSCRHMVQLVKFAVPSAGHLPYCIIQYFSQFKGFQQIKKC